MANPSHPSFAQPLPVSDDYDPPPHRQPGLDRPPLHRTLLPEHELRGGAAPTGGVPPEVVQPAVPTPANAGQPTAVPAPLLGQDPIAAEMQRQQARQQLPAPERGGAPDWVRMPAGLKIPRGARVVFMKFKAEWTAAPELGERQIICWPISVGDKKLALGRAIGDGSRVLEELTKSMIRAIDGQLVSWDGASTAGNVDLFWQQVGEKIRVMLVQIYLQLHTLNDAETVDFFSNCVAVRTAG